MTMTTHAGFFEQQMQSVLARAGYRHRRPDEECGHCHAPVSLTP